MRVLDTIMFPERGVRHYVRVTDYTTLCGRFVYSTDLNVSEDRHAFQYPACKTCLRVRLVHDIDTRLPEPDDSAAFRAQGISSMVEIPARVFRVQGKTDTYTVTIPIDPWLATICTCMAGKVNPDKQCKHQVAVLTELVDRKEVLA